MNTHTVLQAWFSKDTLKLAQKLLKYHWELVLHQVLKVICVPNSTMWKTIQSMALMVIYLYSVYIVPFLQIWMDAVYRNPVKTRMSVLKVF